MVADYQGSQFEGRVSGSIKLAAQPRELQFVTPTHKERPAGDLRQASLALFFAAISRRNRLVFDPQLLRLFLAAPAAAAPWPVGLRTTMSTEPTGHRETPMRRGGQQLCPY